MTVITTKEFKQLNKPQYQNYSAARKKLSNLEFYAMKAKAKGKYIPIPTNPIRRKAQIDSNVWIFAMRQTGSKYTKIINAAKIARLHPQPYRIANGITEELGDFDRLYLSYAILERSKIITYDHHMAEVARAHNVSVKLLSQSNRKQAVKELEKTTSVWDLVIPEPQFQELSKFNVGVRN